LKLDVSSSDLYKFDTKEGVSELLSGSGRYLLLAGIVNRSIVESEVQVGWRARVGDSKGRWRW